MRKVPGLPETGFVRLPTVLNLIPISKSSFYKGIAENRYPRQTRIGGVSCWRVDDIRALIKQLEG